MPVLSLACHLSHNTPHIPSRYNNEQTTKQTKAINNSYIYKYLCKCDTNRAGHFTLDAYASRPVACPPLVQTLQWRHSERDGFSNHRRLIVFLIVGSGADKKKHRSSASLAFVRGIHRWPVNFPQKGPVTQKMFPFDDVLMEVLILGRMVIITGWELCYIYKTRCPYCCQRLKSI